MAASVLKIRFALSYYVSTHVWLSFVWLARSDFPLFKYPRTLGRVLLYRVLGASVNRVAGEDTDVRLNHHFLLLPPPPPPPLPTSLFSVDVVLVPLRLYVMARRFTLLFNPFIAMVSPKNDQ